MSGYRPWGSAGAAAAKRGKAAAAARHRSEQRKEYDAYRAEASACGHEVESFEEWMGEVSSRELAEQRAGLDHYSLNDACYYGDF
jgi:hypothetical protein